MSPDRYLWRHSAALWESDILSLDTSVVASVV